MDTEDTFSDYSKKLKKIRKDLSGRVSTSMINTQLHFLDYCLRRLSVSSQVMTTSVDICAHHARCILEIEVILKWLSKKSERYDVFRWSAEQAHIDILKSMQNLQVLETKDESCRFNLKEQFSQTITVSQNRLGNPHSKKYKAMSIDANSLKNIKKIAQDIGIGERVIAYYDLYSKISHPTSWIIFPTSDKDEHQKIIQEAILATKESLEEIIKIYNDF